MAKGTESLDEGTPQKVANEEEQLYSIPENWNWIKLGTVSTNQYGYTASAVEDDSYPKFLRITDIQEDGVNWNTVPNCIISTDDIRKYALRRNDIVIARIGATTGKSYIIADPPQAVFASYLIRLRVNEVVFPKYVYFFLQTSLYWTQISELSSGIALPGVNSSKLRTLAFPLPPQPEQHRIVERIESLFAKLDEAKEKAQAVVDGYEDRKAAILHQAFTGELTAEWRKRGGCSFSDWEELTVGSVSEVKGGKRVPKGMSLTEVNTGHPYIKAGNLKQGTVIDEGMTYVPDEVLPYIKRYTVNTGDVYITNVGACIGDCGIIPPKYDGANLTENAVKLTNLLCDGEYLAWYLSSNKVQQYIKDLVASATLGKLSIERIKTIPILLPPEKEQKEIIRVTKNMLNGEKQANKAAKQVISQIDTMKKAILARAFRGELGTNDPTEPPVDIGIS